MMFRAGRSDRVILALLSCHAPCPRIWRGRSAVDHLACSLRAEARGLPVNQAVAGSSPARAADNACSSVGRAPNAVVRSLPACGPMADRYLFLRGWSQVRVLPGVIASFLTRKDQHSGSTGFDVDLRAHLTAPAGAHTAETTVGKHELPTTTATPLSPSRRKRVDVRGARVARRRHHTSWTGALRRRPVETQTVVEAPTPRRQGPLRALRAATRVSEGVFWSSADPGSIPGESTTPSARCGARSSRVVPSGGEIGTSPIAARRDDVHSTTSRGGTCRWDYPVAGQGPRHAGPSRADHSRGAQSKRELALRSMSTSVEGHLGLGRLGSSPPRTSGVMRAEQTGRALGAWGVSAKTWQPERRRFYLQNEDLSDG